MSDFNFEFDFKNPRYSEVFRYRAEKLKKIRANPEILPALKDYYRNNIAQFIIDWGCTADPRNLEKDAPAVMPFMLFPKQKEWVDWVILRWKSGESGVTEKSRDMGVTWLSVAVAVSICVLNHGVVIGFVSRKEDMVDRLGDPNCIFFKIRQYVSLLPPEFRGGFQLSRDASHMKMLIPEKESAIIGESGDNPGRGGRLTIAFVDEAAHLRNPAAVELALSATTSCRIDISTPHGMANPFAEKIHGGHIPSFRLHWRDHPRKDEEWYEKEKRRLNYNELVIAQELDLNYHASVAGVLIPNEWMQAAIDSHIKINIDPTGEKMMTLDVADEGADKNAVCGIHGVLVEHITHWSGVRSDLFETTQKAFEIADANGYKKVRYDGDGMGAAVRGDAKKINESRLRERKQQIIFIPFKGSWGVLSPEARTYGDPNKDMFANFKAQSWWAVAERFRITYEAVVKGMPFNPSDVISLSGTMPQLQELIVELSQVIYDYKQTGEMLIVKNPKGTKSPNRADALMMAFAPKPQGFFNGK